MVDKRLADSTDLAAALAEYTPTEAMNALIALAVSNVRDGVASNLDTLNEIATALGLKLNTSSFSDAGVTGKLLTGFSAGAGTVSATDSILQALNKIVGNIDGLGGGGGIPFYSPDAPYETPSAEDEEFNGGTLDGKWAVFGADPVPLFLNPSCVSLFADNYGVGSSIVQDVADVDCKFRVKIHPPRDNTTSHQCGLVAKKVGSNGVEAFYGEWTNFEWQALHSPNYITNGGASGGKVGDIRGSTDDARPVWIEADYNAGTNLLRWKVSNDGVEFFQITSVTLTGGLDKIGIHCMGGGGHRFNIDWFRKVQGGGTGQEF